MSNYVPSSRCLHLAFRKELTLKLLVNNFKFSCTMMMTFMKFSTKCNASQWPLSSLCQINPKCEEIEVADGHSVWPSQALNDTPAQRMCLMSMTDWLTDCLMFLGEMSQRDFHISALKTNRTINQSLSPIVQVSCFQSISFCEIQRKKTKKLKFHFTYRSLCFSPLSNWINELPWRLEWWNWLKVKVNRQKSRRNPFIIGSPLSQMY